MILEQWFATPTWYDVFSNISEKEYNDAINYCNDLSRISPGRVISNVGGWQSESLLYEDIKETPLRVFFEQLKPAVKEALTALGVLRELPINNIWININGTNNGNRSHDHPNSSISGVFYLTQNNSEIIFHRNRDIAEYHLEWLESNRKTNLSNTTVSYSPKRGQYLIFPSWLMHSVRPNISTEKRISIAFNVATV